MPHQTRTHRRPDTGTGTGRYVAATEHAPLSSLPAAALRQCLHEGYTKVHFRADVMAGLVVGVVALPLSMALSIAVGAPPQHGLYTAIIAGFITALLGGSRMQVTGPTAAFIVILAPIYGRFGLEGLLLSGLMGGVMLLLMGVFRLGQLITYIPHPVTTGFTAGIGTVIATLQLKDLLGLTMASNPDHYIEKLGVMWSARASASGWEFALGAATFAMLWTLPRLTRGKVPAPLVALPAAALAAWFMNRHAPGTIETISSRFPATHGIPQTPPLPMLPWLAPGPNGVTSGAFNFYTLQQLLPGAFAVAILGAIESLLSAVVADGMARTKHDPDAELMALGAANIVAPFFGGIPATGAIARTATNIRSGARTPVSAMVHSVTVLAAVLVLAPAIGFLPMTSLAALLVLVAWNMSEAKHFVHTVKIAPRGDVAVLLTCFGLTVFIDMVYAVSAGMVLASFIFMRRMAEVTKARVYDRRSDVFFHDVPDGVLVYDIAGPLFFGAAQKAMATLGAIGDKIKVVILRLDQVPVMDATGLVALESALERLQKRNCRAIIAGLQRQPRQLLKDAGVIDRYQAMFLQPDIDSALKVAADFLPKPAESSPSPAKSPDSSSPPRPAQG